MDEVPAFLPPAVMEGYDGYNRDSQVQAGSLSPALPMLERAVTMAAVPSEPQPIVIADYGSSQGQNSLAPVLAAIRVLRQRIGRDRAIMVVHTDLPENDFTVLFQTLITSPESYLRNDAAVFPSAIGRSFYEQILPSGSVTVGCGSVSRQHGVKPPEMQRKHTCLARKKQVNPGPILAICYTRSAFMIGVSASPEGRTGPPSRLTSFT